MEKPCGNHNSLNAMCLDLGLCQVLEQHLQNSWTFVLNVSFIHLLNELIKHASQYLTVIFKYQIQFRRSIGQFQLCTMIYQ